MGKILLFVSCFLICLALIFLSDLKVATAAPPKPVGPVIGQPVKAVSFDGDLRKLPYVKPKAIPSPPRPAPRSQPQPRVQPSAPLRDPVRQTALAPLSMPGIFRSFDGLDRFNWGARLQPDATGDAGPNHYIQTLNTSLAVFDKNGNRLAATTFDIWWTQTISGPCYSGNNHGNAIVVYDKSADRWLISDMAGQNGKSYWCIAVSKSGDPVSGGWWFYQYDPAPGTNLFPDDPRVGVWPDAFYMSSILLDPSANWAWRTVRTFAFDRTAMFNGKPINSVSFDIGYHVNFVNPLWVLPSNFRGAPPPVGTPNFFVTVQDPNSMWLWKFHVDWTNPLSSTMTGQTGPYDPPTLTTASFTPIFTSTFVLQPNGIQLDPHGDDRLLPQLQYRNIGGIESLWAAQVVSSSAVSGIRWYEIRNPNGTPTIYQQDTFQPDLNYRFLPSIAADGNGNAALGYTISSATMFPSIMYAGRLITDTLGTLGQGEATLFAGTGSQTNSTDHGWGDYTTLTVDPVDDCTFWFTSEYYTTTSSADNWLTRIGAFKYPSCNPTPFPTNHTVMFDGQVTQNVEWNPNSDRLGSMIGIDYYATWDANHLSVAMAGGALSANTYVAVVDTDPSNRTSTNTGSAGALVCAGFNGNGKGNFALARSSGSTARYQAIGGAWAAWTPSINTDAMDNGSNNVEFQFQWSDIGLLPTSSSVGLYLYVCNGTSLLSSWPPENVQTGTNPVLNTEVVFSTKDAGRIPRTYGRHVGDDQVTVSAGGTFNLLNGYVSLSNVPAVNGCTFTASVNGNADTTDPNTIRRTYTLTPGSSCTGLTANLTLKYEDGTLANNAPDELAGFTESSLKLLRWSGTSWFPFPTTVDTVNNAATATSISQFSPWSLGRGSPTAVTLSSFSAVPMSKGEPASQAVLGLGLVELLAIGLAFSGKRIVRQ